VGAERVTPEGRVKAFVKRVLNRFAESRDVHIWTHWPVQTGYGAPTLDMEGCLNGYAFAIETKAPGEKLTARQELTRADMEKSGKKVFVIGEETDRQFKYSGVKELLTWLVLHS
jgi:hypothetical protein